MGLNLCLQLLVVTSPGKPPPAHACPSVSPEFMRLAIAALIRFQRLYSLVSCFLPAAVLHSDLIQPCFWSRCGAGYNDPVLTWRTSPDPARIAWTIPWPCCGTQ